LFGLEPRDLQAIAPQGDGGGRSFARGRRRFRGMSTLSEMNVVPLVDVVLVLLIIFMLTAHVIARQATLDRELKNLEASDERLAGLDRARVTARDAYLTAARALGRARRLAAGEFAGSLERLLADLAMERTRFEVRFADAEVPESNWSAAGIDEVEFFLSPNPGEELRPLARIVSGGELSRIMLAIKTLGGGTRTGFSEAARLPPGSFAPGLIFDEIDQGIGGRVGGDPAAEVGPPRMTGLEADDLIDVEIGRAHV
jgi:hypothetical protein